MQELFGGANAIPFKPNKALQVRLTPSTPAALHDTEITLHPSPSTPHAPQADGHSNMDGIADVTTAGNVSTRHKSHGATPRLTCKAISTPLSSTPMPRKEDIRFNVLEAI